MENVATWADSAKFGKAYGWTRSLHYVDPKDNPSKSCSYDDDRDCADGQCIVGAITNFTLQASCTSKDAYEPFKFITHLIGDLTQPLHACGRDKGGNGDKVNFDGNSVNFHSLWDTSLVVKRMKEVASNQDAYASYLVKKIQSGTYRASSSKWVSTHQIGEKNHNGNFLAVIDWATDSDTLNCAVVWGPFDQNPKQDFGVDYYTQVATTVDMQLAKGGVRLADWVNQLYSQC